MGRVEEGKDGRREEKEWEMAGEGRMEGSYGIRRMPTTLELGFAALYPTYESIVGGARCPAHQVS